MRAAVNEEFKEELKLNEKTSKKQKKQKVIDTEANHNVKEESSSDAGVRGL